MSEERVALDTVSVSQTSEQLKLKDRLFELSMQKKWHQIAQLYENNPEAASFILTKFGETALHVALLGYKKDAANHIETMIKSTPLDLLATRNEMGNTPLHLAAVVGWKEMCSLIASINHELIRVCNIQGQTPIYVAVHHGNVEAFRCLRQIYGQSGDSNDVSLLRDRHGNTILHVAISNENFELALEIIGNYPDLITMVNEKEESPLHVLSTKSSVFKSRSSIYRCLFSEKLKPHELQQEDHNKKKVDEENQRQYKSVSAPNRKHGLLAACCATWIMPLQLTYMAILIILGCGTSKLRGIQRKEKQRSLAIHIMSKLIDYESLYKSDGQRSVTGLSPTFDRQLPPVEEIELKRAVPVPVPLLKATEKGILLIVEKILITFPVAIQDVTPNGKNVLMLAAENRQAKMLDYLISLNLPDCMFHKVDDQGNNILHLAANKVQLDSCQILGATRLMQWEHNWYQYVKDVVPRVCSSHENMQGKTPWQIFSSTHEDLMKESVDWYSKIAASYSIIAALVATVALGTTAAVTGGTNDKGFPIRQGGIIGIYALSTMAALCSSIVALFVFIGIASYSEYHFKSTSRKLLIGITFLFGSIVSILASFLQGHDSVFWYQLGEVAFPLYTSIGVALSIFAIVNMRLFFVVKINVRPRYMRDYLWSFMG